MPLLFGNGVEGVSDIVIEEMGEMYYVLDREVVAEKEGFDVWRANGHIFVSTPYKHLDTCTIIIKFS